MIWIALATIVAFAVLSHWFVFTCWCADTSTPFCWTFQFETHVAVVERTTATLTIDYFVLHEYHVGTIGFPSSWILNLGQFQFVGFTRCLDSVFRVVGNGFQFACLVWHVLERVEVAIFVLSFDTRIFSVDAERHILSVGYDKNARNGVTLLVVPMSHDIGARSDVVHPSVPHHLMSEKGILWNAHGVSHTTAAVVLFTSAVSLRVGEDDFHTTRIHTSGSAWTLRVVIVPTTHQFLHEIIRIAVIGWGRGIAIERTFTLLVERIAP